MLMNRLHLLVEEVKHKWSDINALETNNKKNIRDLQGGVK
jgi:hypothetical protein